MLAGIPHIEYGLASSFFAMNTANGHPVQQLWDSSLARLIVKGVHIVKEAGRTGATGDLEGIVQQLQNNEAVGHLVQFKDNERYKQRGSPWTIVLHFKQSLVLPRNFQLTDQPWRRRVLVQQDLLELLQCIIDALEDEGKVAISIANPNVDIDQARPKVRCTAVMLPRPLRCRA